MVRLTDLPNDIIARIFILLSPFSQLRYGSLSHASNAFSLALCSSSLLQIFRQTLLTSIDATNYPDEPLSPYFPGAEVRDPYHLASLARLAGPYLRQLMIPDYEESEEFTQWPLLDELEDCPNLESLGFHDPHIPSECLEDLLERVPRLRIVTPGDWTLQQVGSRVQILDLVNVQGSTTTEVLNMLVTCTQLRNFYITFLTHHDAAFIPLLVGAINQFATSVLHVRYCCPGAPMPVQPSDAISLSSSRVEALSTLRIDAGRATSGVVEAFAPIFSESTYISTTHRMVTLIKYGGMTGITRCVGIIGPMHNVEEVVVKRKEEAEFVVKHSSRLRRVEIGRGAADIVGICDALEGKKLDKVTIPGNLLQNGSACAKGLAGAKEIVISALGRDDDIWKLVIGLPGLMRGLRWARHSGGVRVIHVVGCLQVLDGVCQYGRVTGYGVLRGLLWEMDQLYEDGGVEFCGLREGVRRLVEERDRMMVVDEM